MENNYIKSPLNYVGGKYKILDQIIPLFPKEINNFVDLFAGGVNVGINIKAKNYIINDIESEVIKLYKYMYETDLNEILQGINNYTKIYRLDRENKEGYINLRTDYNLHINKHPLHFYTLICHSFSNQIRFNSKREFNMPFGKRTFNERMEYNFIEFVTKIKSKNIKFTSDDFSNLKLDTLTKNDFVYCDPPYLITNASYNENGGWTKEHENRLLSLLDSLHSQGVKFALSNVFENKGKKNDILIEWSRNYKVNYLNNTYSNCNYQAKDKSKNSTVEVLITNY